MAAELYGLRKLAEKIEDRPDNSTRFLIIGKQDPSATGADVTSLVATAHRNQPGALFTLLKPLADAQIDMTRIESRPVRGSPVPDFYFFIDFVEIAYIIVPILAPIAATLGINPLWYAILVAMNLQTSFLTPPMAMSAYYLKGVAPKEVLLSTIFKGCLPFVSMVFIAMAAMYIFPAVTNYLPDLLYGNR